MCVIKPKTAELEGLSVDSNAVQRMFLHLFKLMLFYHRKTRPGFKNAL